MTRYLLDTTVLIDAARNREPATSRILALAAAGDELGVSPVNVAEFQSGTPEGRRSAADAFLSSFVFWPISSSAARQAGIWRYDYARQGRSLGTADVLIAAVAHEIGAVLVTRDLGDFPMEGITLLEP